ncbi:MAG: right-handed parallel beta-helix repeat-containing protein [Lachnospiraceae bacterium]|nr:right-handed parallel beta-helix repeat-containing protein [Lachnospiraceae bacterium]
MKNNKLNRLLAMTMCFVLGVGSMGQTAMAAEDEPFYEEESETGEFFEDEEDEEAAENFDKDIPPYPVFSDHSDYCTVSFNWAKSVSENDYFSVSVNYGEPVDPHLPEKTAGSKEAAVKAVMDNPSFAGWFRYGTEIKWDPTVPVTSDIKLVAQTTEELEQNSVFNLSTKDLWLVTSQTYDLGKNFGTWSVDGSGNGKVLKLKKNKISAKKKAGDVVIKNNEGRTVTVHVRKPVIDEGGTKKLTTQVGISRVFTVSFGEDSNEKEAETRTHYDVIWTTSNINVAKVYTEEYNNYGCVLGIGKGTAKVYATINGKKLKASVKVTNAPAIKKITEPEVPEAATRVFIPFQKATLKIKGITLKNASWKNYDGSPLVTDPDRKNSVKNSVVSITNKGVLTAIGVGTVSLNVADTKGATANITIVVGEPVKSIHHVNQGYSRTISFYGFKPKNGQNWKSSDEKVAKVVNGKVTGVGTGLAVISCTYGGLTYKDFVYVENPGLTTDKTLKKDGSGYNYKMEMSAGQTYMLRSKGEVYQNLAFVSSDPSAVTVDEHGNVTAVRVESKATLTAKINGKTIKVKVTVGDLPLNYIDVDRDADLLEDYMSVKNPTDVDYINAAINLASKDGGKNYSYTVLITKDKTIKNGASIELKENVRLMIRSTIKMEKTDSDTYSMISIKANNVSIIGGTLKGDIAEHKASEIHKGRGIEISGASGVKIRDMDISNFQGDGIYLHGDVSADIDIINCKLSSNGRSNIGIASGKNIKLDKLTVEPLNTGAAAPSAGILIEPAAANAVSDISITNSSIKEQANKYKEGDENSHRFVAFLAKKTDNAEKKAKNVTVKNCTFTGDIVNFSAAGAQFSNIMGSGKLYKYVSTATSGLAETIVVVDKTATEQQ